MTLDDRRLILEGLGQSLSLSPEQVRTCVCVRVCVCVCVVCTGESVEGRREGRERERDAKYFIC